MKQSTIALLILLAPVAWLLFRPRLSILKARFGRALRIGFVVYFGILAVRMVQSGFDEAQITVAALSLAVFGGVWVAAWLVTSHLARQRGGEREN